MAIPPYEASSALKRRRLALGLTQSELAVSADVSRQLVAAVEAGRNMPAVDAALRLAHALGTTVEELFRLPGPPVASVLGERLPERALVRVGRVGDRLVASPLPDHGVAGAGWAKPDGVWKGGELQLFPQSNTHALVLAGCEPAFGLAEQMLGGLGPRSLISVSAPSGRAASALERRRLHAAVVHGPASLHPPLEPVRRIHVARWQVGLGVPRHVAGSLEVLLSGKIIQREPSAAIQQALERACSAVGTAPPAVAGLAGGHLESARLATSLGYPCLTTEAAARAFDLRFLALEGHVVELWLAEEWWSHPGAQALLDLLTTSSFTNRVASYGGYDLARCGSLVT